MMNSTWEPRDLRVLEATVKYHDEHAGHSFPEGRDLQETTGLSMDDVRRALIALDDTFIKVQKVMDGGVGSHWIVTRVYSNARLAVGQWPTPETLADRLVAALEKAASDNTTSEDERNKMKDTAHWLGSGGGREALVSALSSVVMRSAGTVSGED